MHFNIINWLFTDPCTATNCVAATTGATSTAAVQPETFHYYLIWLIFCSVGVLIAFYYSVEGRKRFVKNKPIIKYMLDRYLGWLTVICLVGYPMIFAREYLAPYFFAWRVWRYLWLAALLAWAIILIVYLVRKYPKERANYRAYQNRQQYIPKSSKRKTASSR